MKTIRYIPYGYTVRDGRTIVEHDEADVIREIFSMYITGSSLKDIAEWLTARRIPYTEKIDEWDKARVSRIIENIRYIGDDEYDPIIDETIYQNAINAKRARQQKTPACESEGIRLLRNRVKCEKCGQPMVRRINSRFQVRESWVCINKECKCRIRISDSDLLQKITLLMNRLIANSELLIPKPKIRTEDSPMVRQIKEDIRTELQSDYPSDDLLISKIRKCASQLYKESQAKNMIAVQLARKRVMLMKPQENFNGDYFTDIVAYITLGANGKVSLHTNVDSIITEGGEQE